MTLPAFGQNIARIDISFDDLLDVEIVAPAAGDILIFDGDSWDNQPVTGAITITAGGVTSISAGVIVDADISATAEIQVSKLADGAARQVLQTDALGTGVEWTDNVDLPGTLDVTGITTLDAAVVVATAAGVDYTPGADADVDVITINVTGTPIFKWDEAGDRFSSNFGIILTGGNLDLDSNGTILNIGTAGFNITGSGLVDVAGVSGNIWDSTQLVHEGTGISKFERTNVATADLRTLMTLQLTSTGDMADGFGPKLEFQIEDSGASALVGQIAFRRAGADNTGDFVLETFVAGVANEAFRVSSGGIGSFDLAGAGTGLPSLHDDKDDAMVLYRGLSQGDLESLESIGIMERKDSGSGWWLNMQPMMMLTAGGVYQNRARLDAGFDQMNGRVNEHETRFSSVEEQMDALLQAQDILREQVVALGATPQV